MSKLDEAIRGVCDVPGGAVRDRLLSEVKYARRVSDALGGKHADLLLSAAEKIKRAAERDGALTDASALAVEEFLLPMAEDCKKYRLLLCGHAHIDMNWMWRYDETVQITLDTFKTVLSLMDEFPGFTFSQSQASVYQIAEEYAPDLIERIAERAREGR
jgi:alpha-mannosidase